MKMLAFRASWSAAILVAAVFVLSSACEKTIYETDPRLFNDAYHGNIVGKVVQNGSGARVIVSQEVDIDSTGIDSTDGAFRIENLPVGNYDLHITAENYRIYTLSNVRVEGAGTTYIGEIDLSTVPDLVAAHYPADQAEIVYNNRFSELTISVMFTRPMDRESVEAAFSTEPATEGIFYWGLYTEAPSWLYFRNPYDESKNFDPGATISTYSKITSFAYRIAQKDSYVDTTYRVTLATSAHDTAGNALRFPLEFSFRTIQSSTSINGIQTSPFHGDVGVDLLATNGIQVIFPRNMDQASTEKAITMAPAMDKIFIWPQRNQLTIYTGGPLLADTTYVIRIDSTAKDLDGTPMGKPFTFSFSTAPVQVRATSPRNGELYVDPKQTITLWFNTYMVKSSIETAFSISPAVRGTFAWGTAGSGRDKTAITFRPGEALRPNTKYTVTLSTAAQDLFGSPLREPYVFAFVTRPE